MSPEQRNILTLASDVFIHKIRKWYMYLMHILSKTWRLLDGPEVHVDDDIFSYCLLLTIIIKFQQTTLPIFNRIKL